MLSRLTWNYRKDEDSNIYKLFATLAPEIEHLKEVFEKIESWGGIENAEGSTLDLIGEDVRQERLGMNDEQYRQRLRFRTVLNRSDADINSVNIAMRAIAGANFVRLYEAEKKEPYLEPAAVIAQIQKLYPEMPFQEMENILAAGVRLLWAIHREEQLRLSLAIHERHIKKIISEPDLLEQMQYDKKLHLGTYDRQTKKISAEIDTVSSVDGTKELESGIYCRMHKIVREV